MTSKRLKKQILNTFGFDSVEEQIFMSVNSSGTIIQTQYRDILLHISQTFPDFVERVDSVYAALEAKLELATRNLDISSSELNEANDQPKNLNQTFDALLNSLSQAFILIDSNGICQSIYSIKAIDVFGKRPNGLQLSEVLNADQAEANLINDWIEQVFNQVLDFEDLMMLAPTGFKHPEDRHIEITYQPVRDENKKITYIVLIATDKTDEVIAKKNFEKLKDSVERLSMFVENASETNRAIKQVSILSNELENLFLLKDYSKREEIGRVLHTAKSMAGVVKAQCLKEEIHHLESLLLNEGENSYFDVIEKNLHKITNEVQSLNDENKNFQTKYGQGSSSSSNSREDVISVIHGAFAKFGLANDEISKKILEQIEIDLSKESLASMIRSQAKSVNEIAIEKGKNNPILEFKGDVRVVPEKFNELCSTVSHIFNNMVIHGIETPEARQSNGKPETGKIQVEIEKLDNLIQIRFSDDGAGINREALLKKGRESGLIPENVEVDDEQIYGLVFADGVSTTQSADQYSGRGVGMSAVRHAVTKLGGIIRVKSEAKKGSEFQIKVPA